MRTFVLFYYLERAASFAFKPFVEDYFPRSIEYDVCTILDDHIALGLGGGHGVAHVDVAASNEAV